MLRLGLRSAVWSRVFEGVRIGLYVACVAAAAVVWTDLLARARQWADEPAPTKVSKQSPHTRIASRMIATEGSDTEWNRSLRIERTWRSRPRSSSPQVYYPAQRSGLLTTPNSPWALWATSGPRRGGEEEDSESPWKSASPSGIYRTVCVRLCDGYNWPISFATTPENFERDSRICESSCSSAARLYIHQNPGQDPEQMVDLKGRPYSSLSVAYRYRKEMVPSCKCKPEPWDEASLARHRAYAALEAKRKPGQKKAEAPADAKAVEAERRRVEALKRAGLHPEDGPMQYARAASAKAKTPASQPRAASLANATVSAKVPDIEAVELSDGTSVRIMRLGVEPSPKQPRKGKTISKAAPPSHRQSWVPPAFELR